MHDLEDEKAEKAQLQEAAEIWNLASELRAGCGPNSKEIINKIKDMEERDVKEAERLGTRRHTP